MHIIIPKFPFFNSANMLQVAGDVYPIKYTADSFFFLHTINAYEEKDQACIYYQQQSWVLYQHPPTQWNLRGGR
jgi:hypothetical protein